MATLDSEVRRKMFECLNDAEVKLFNEYLQELQWEQYEVGHSEGWQEGYDDGYEDATLDSEE